VFFHAFLPLLVDAHPRVRQKKRELETQLYDTETHLEQQFNTTEDKTDSDNETLGREKPADSQVELEMEFAREDAFQKLMLERDSVANEISTHGFGAAYIGAVLSLLLVSMKDKISRINSEILSKKVLYLLLTSG
jgi:hypothetical protein